MRRLSNRLTSAQHHLAPLRLLAGHRRRYLARLRPPSHHLQPLRVPRNRTILTQRKLLPPLRLFIEMEPTLGA